MKLKTIFWSTSFLMGLTLFVTGCSKKVLVDKAKEEPKVEIVPLKQTNR